LVSDAVGVVGFSGLGLEDLMLFPVDL